jgi:hypothetical protein
MDAADYKPQSVYFAIGMNPRDAGAVRGHIGVIKREQDNPVPIVLRVRNTGSRLFTLSVEHSTNNDYRHGTTGDPYGAVNVRYGGASVASVVVQPGGEAVVLIESMTKPYFLLKVSQAEAEAGARGTLHAIALVGGMAWRQQTNVP